MKLKAIGALVLAVIVTACSAPPQVEPTPSPDQPTRGGVFRIVGPYDVITLDPSPSPGVWLVDAPFARAFGD